MSGRWKWHEDLLMRAIIYYNTKQGERDREKRLRPAPRPDPDLPKDTGDFERVEWIDLRTGSGVLPFKKP